MGFAILAATCWIQININIGNVNTIGLALPPGYTQQAVDIVEYRRNIGGFTSLDQAMAVAPDLFPEMVALSGADIFVDCSKEKELNVSN